MARHKLRHMAEHRPDTPGHQPGGSTAGGRTGMIRPERRSPYPNKGARTRTMRPMPEQGVR
jgi:hypothetical protein